MTDFLTIEQLETATRFVYDTNLMHKTPMLCNVGRLFDLPDNIDLYLKLENMQATGSFKIRGILNQIGKLKQTNNQKSQLVTFSGGNYGRAFSYMCQMWNFNGKVLLPNTAHESRVKLIESFGVETDTMPSSCLLKSIEEHVASGAWHSLHPFDDLDLIAGYSSIAFEIMETVDPDICLVCCGGGGLLAGVSCALGLSGSRAVIYGIEPDTANTMYQSFEQDKPVTDLTSKSIAAGLAPPLAGTTTYNYCKRFVNGGILLVTDSEIKTTCKLLFEKGLKVELSGCAAMAALLHNKIPDLKNQSRSLKIAVILSGGNVTASELSDLMSQ